jgi:hypothetical protein
LEIGYFSANPAFAAFNRLGYYGERVAAGGRRLLIASLFSQG